ncbi:MULTISPECIES: beta-ketoacyl synthase N-terminal-like domain-containing protein [Paenibacillus]|uniref:beta-ketoacyl synthase N-terminal-like domain-containing protein n=1 Tax=Paenibacillus TaxID=44249 RepID=UPI0022B907B4|nr:beta-ketoacyl synthase N-terminal-like domain-containing protein [Paenibacillus caseinilyticus]MCZ8521624.1 beta-ketoacyl synthase N-terminal-like domain-containing protein [Paenibacillus caseinilyticus]
MRNARSTENYGSSDIVITGVGVTSAIGQGKADFTSALLEGRHAFGVMQRPGRQQDTSFLGAELPPLVYPDSLSKKLLRAASLTGQAALVTLAEAWEEARLEELDSERVGLVIGGSNVQQREIGELQRKYEGRAPFLAPSYGLSFMDTDLCGFCTEQFGIRGFAYTAGGASASGQLAVIQAVQAVQAGQVDACIAMGALTDLSFWECQALRSLGAMGSDRYALHPELACRPFDRDRDGFIYGEGCAAVVVERAYSAEQRGLVPYARVAGWGIGTDGNRNPNPSCEGEMRVIAQALGKAGLAPGAIDYVNPHGTGSGIGDETELKALRDSGLSHARINATKSITGHGLTAAGTVEIAATLLQMRQSRLHPTRNLEHPMDDSLRWVGGRAEPHAIGHALSLSMGFGGINTALIVSRWEDTYAFGR